MGEARERRAGEHEADLDRLLEQLGSAEGTASDVREEVLQRASLLIDEVIEESFKKSGYTQAELFRPGYLGLLNAVYNFDLSRGLPFRDYARNLIRGEIRQHIRDHAGALCIPQWMRDLNRQIEKAEARLLRETGKLPTLGELADRVNITEEGIAEVFKAREALSYVSLDAEQREKDPTPKIDPQRIRSKHPVVFPIEQRIRIASALERLSELQQYLFRHLFDSAG
jgi:RNA polymerase sigma-B factor